MPAYGGSTGGSWGGGFDAAPPPPGSASDPAAWDEQAATPTRTLPGQARPRTGGMPFDAELDMTELDDRERPGPTWTGRSRELSRAHMVVRSRRMCYTGKRILIAVHLIDDRPVRLAGKVYSCEYDSDGMYKVGLDLFPVPEAPHVQDWFAKHT